MSALVTNEKIKPISPGERVRIIDALRGLALLGVLIVNAETEFRVSVFQQFLAEPPGGSAWDRFVDAFVLNAIEFKAFIVFSFLFGVGLAIQFERMARAGKATPLLLRRLLVLLLFGCIHLFLIWNGDILVEYAVAGLIVLPLLRLSQRAILVSCALAFVTYAALPAFLPPDLFPASELISQHVAAANEVFSTGGFLDVRRFEIGELAPILPLHAFVFPRTVALMLLGVFTWRSGVFTRANATPIWLGVGFVGLLVWAVFGTTGIRSDFAPYVKDVVAPLLATVGIAALYAAVFFAMIGRLRRLQDWLIPVGRMAFSNYIMQSVLLAMLFYGWGFGLRTSVDAAATLWICLGLFATQAIISRLWLRHFRFGPLEWLWRTLTYGRPQPMEVAATTA